MGPKAVMVTDPNVIVAKRWGILPETALSTLVEVMEDTIEAVGVSVAVEVDTKWVEEGSSAIDAKVMGTLPETVHQKVNVLNVRAMVTWPESAHLQCMLVKMEGVSNVTNVEK